MAEIAEVELGELLNERAWKIAVAESCTGGLVGHRLTNVPGSSSYYLGSVTAYANLAKVRLLEIDIEIINKFGAVSAETVEEMAKGIRKALDAQIGISISGIAGPGGGSIEKPVGLVWIGLSSPNFAKSQKFLFDGDRIDVKEQAAETALQCAISHLKEQKG
jgi:PncC family amidohydrolase